MNGQAATYDFENHLVSLGSVASYIYDADGNRYSAASGGATTSYVVDTSLPYASVVEEYSSTMLAARYDYGDDLIRVDHGTVASYYLFDGLGSTRQLVSTAGAVTDTWSYSAFGELASHTGTTANPFLFNAQQFDQASGDYFLRARYYDQSNGRFVSQDSFEGSNDDPVTLHRYLYAGVNPVSYVDPGGMDFSLMGSLVTIGGMTALGLGAGYLAGTTENRAKSTLYGALYGFEGGASLVYAATIGKLGPAILAGVFGAFIAVGIDVISQGDAHPGPYDLKRLPLAALEGFSTGAAAMAIGEGNGPFEWAVDAFTLTYFQDIGDISREGVPDFPSPTKSGLANALSDALLQGILAYAIEKSAIGIRGPIAKEAEELLTRTAKLKLESEAESAAIIVVQHLGAGLNLIRQKVLGIGPADTQSPEEGK